MAEEVVLSGYVYDVDGSPLELVNVYDTNSKRGTVTDEKGFYTLTISNERAVSIQFSLVGFETKKLDLNSGFDTQTNSITLPISSEILDDVDVVALERQTSFTEKINVNDSRLMSAGSGNIESLLVTFQGVSSNNELSSQYSVRGGSYDENMVYVNGVEVYRPLLIRSGQQEGLSFVNPDLIESISFSAGGFDARYGDKLSSVLDIQYKKPKKGVEGSVGISLLGATAYLGQAGDKFTQIHGLRYKNNSYLLGAMDTKGEYKPNFIDYQTYMSYQFNQKWELSFLGNYSRNGYTFIPKNRETTFGGMMTTYNFKVYFDGQEKDVFSTYFGSLNLNYKPNNNLKFNLIASSFNTNELETYDINGEYYLDEIMVDPNTGKKLDSESLGVGRYHEHARNTLSETVFNLSHNASYKARGNELMWGLSYQFEQINDHVSEWKMRDSSGYALPFSSDKINFEYSLRGQFNHSANRFMAYIQDTYKFHFNNEDVFSITAGVRTHFYDFNKEWIVSPRVLMSYVPHWKHNFVFRLASGLYSQPPFYKELKTVRLDENNNGILYLNSKIKSQKSVQVVGGFDYYFKLGVRPFKLTVETYYKHLYDIVPYNVDNVQIIYQGSNNATGYSAGVDMKLFGEFIKGTDSWISLSFMRTEEDLKDDEYVDSEGKVHHPGYIPRPTDQRFNISIFFQDYFPKFPKNKFNIKMIFAGGLPTGPPKGERYQATYRMPTYIRVDLGYSRQLIGGKPMELRKQHVIKNMWMQLEVLNLLGIKNVNSYYWITGVNSVQYAVPNYLTGRQFNVKLLMDF